ncbi:unnamed protein product [Aureobasidium pullulans]|uniref:BTB domain-containing protein n=2 Tax=Aureobasidium pullulans TaxID=5580 RepID=A0A4S8YIM9_AURPU|nr:hypothetical protein D6D22_00605 [Aureobasidium pullulans]CAC9894040.1 unnamed protein product [Aureobasidium pullulans]
MVNQSPVATATSPNISGRNAKKSKEEWKRNVWRSKTVSRLCVDSDMISLKSKEKRGPKIFHVHRALLCFYSPYHDRLLNGSFLEATSPPTEPLLIEADANVLKLFVSWLYTGKFHMIRQHLLQDDDDDDDKWYIGITKLYILADWLNCTALERLIVTAQQDRLMGSRWNLPTWRSIDLLSHSSLESSGLYQYYLTVYDQHWDGHVGDQTHPDGQSIPATLSEDPMPPHFAYRVLLMKLRTAQNNKGEEKDSCGSLNDETEDDEDATSDFDSEVDSESESESDTDSDADTSAEPTAKKRVREGEDNEGARAKRIKAV